MNDVEAKTDPASPRYPNRFLKRDAAEAYVQEEYAPESYATAVWNIQIKQLRTLLEEARSKHPTGRHFDFACGTGRITRVAEEIFAEVDALDISASMVEVARRASHQAKFYVGNILESPDLCPGPYASITTFRLILNLEPQLRVPVLTQLHRRLMADGTLILNLHGNRHSLRQPALLWKGWRHRHDPDKAQLMLNHMSRNEVENCLESAGFVVEQVHGTGILPQTVYQWPLNSLWRKIDLWLTGLAWPQPFCVDLLFVCKKKALPAP